MMSVIIPVYNGAHILPTTIPAVCALAGVEEILWVDDGSTDDTPQLLAEAGARDARFQVVTVSVNRGRSAARNAGVDASRGSVLLFLDADVEPPVEAACELARAALQPDAVAAVAQIRPIASDPTEPYQDYAVHARRGPDVATAMQSPIPWRFFIAGASAIRRETFEEVGGFPETIAYGEDQALACALSVAHPEGLRLAPTSVRLHDIGDLDRAVENVEAYGAALSALRRRCPEMMPRALDAALGLGRFAKPVAITLRSVIGVTAYPSLRRRLVRYLLASHAIHAATHAPPPAARLGGRDRL